MAISKIVLNGVTQMDLTQDTTDASKTLASYTGHGADGEAFTGSYVPSGGSVTQDQDGFLVIPPNGSGGGGGSSDFSTAEVTVVNNILSDAMCYAATVVAPPVPVLPSTTAGFFNVNGNDTTTETVILYMGNCDMIFETSGTLSGSGNVEFDGTNAYVTGDCTITIS